MSAVACPICRKPSVQQYDPFCSKRCADVDLSRWLNGNYAIPGAPAEEDEDALPRNPAQDPDSEG